MGRLRQAPSLAVRSEWQHRFTIDADTMSTAKKTANKGSQSPSLHAAESMFRKRATFIPLLRGKCLGYVVA